METQYSNCPNCQAKIKSGTISNNEIITDEKKIRLIMEFTDFKGGTYCTRCYSTLIAKVKEIVSSRMVANENKMRHLIDCIPVATIHSPLNWNYEVLGMVTGQSSVGTGVVSEVKSSFSDFFGGQSGTINRKLRSGEQLCLSQIRMNAVLMGGNAVIAADIDYSEFGGEKGIVTVCLSGTAIRLNNVEVLGSEKAAVIHELTQTVEQLKYLEGVKLMAYQQ